MTVRSIRVVSLFLLAVFVVIANVGLIMSIPIGTAQVGVSYSSSIAASGGNPPYTYSIITGSLPPGLTLNTTAGAITGIPNQQGNFTFTAQVVDTPIFNPAAPQGDMS